MMTTPLMTTPRFPRSRSGHGPRPGLALALLPLLILALPFFGCSLEAGDALADPAGDERHASQDGADQDYEVQFSEAQWREVLGPEEFHVLREDGTERAFSGDLWDHKKDGVYVCAACGQALFDSSTKFESGTGWPSYWEPIEDGAVGTLRDTSYGMIRTEVVCSRCGSHQGHVFEDGPEPTGLRYCINSVSLDFVPRDEWRSRGEDALVSPAERLASRDGSDG